MKKYIRSFLLIPVWLLTKVIKEVLPEEHPWKYKKHTLKWWVEGGTNLALLFGLIFWESGILLVFSVIKLMK